MGDSSHLFLQVVHFEVECAASREEKKQAPSLLVGEGWG